MFKIKSPSGFLLTIIIITFTMFSCQKEELEEIIPLEEQTVENLSATLKADNSCKSKLISIQKEFEQTFFLNQNSKEIFQANFGIIDWNYKSLYCDFFNPDSLIMFPMVSLLDDQDIQSLLVVDKITRTSEYSFTIIGKHQFSEVLDNINPESIPESVTQLFEFFNYFSSVDNAATTRCDPGEGCNFNGNWWKRFWGRVQNFFNKIIDGGGGDSSGGTSGSGNYGVGPYTSPYAITFWNNNPSTGGNNSGGGSNSGSEPPFCTSPTGISFQNIEPLLENLSQFYNEFGISSIVETSLIQMLQPGCAGLDDYSEFKSCLNGSILCSINENYDLSDEEDSCIRNSPQVSLDVNAFLKGNNPNKNYIVSFYLRLICDYNIDISLDFILENLEDIDQIFDNQDEFDDEASMVIENMLEECIGPFYVMLPALGTESLGEMLSFCTNPIPPINLDPPNCEGCSVGESHIIAEDEYRALQMLDCAIEKLNQFDGIGPEEVKDALYNNFGATSSTAVASYISFLFEHIRRYPYPRKFQIQNNGEGNCGANTLAWSFPVLHFTDVRLCSPSYFNATALTRSGTLIHEWMHLYYFAGDIAYIWQGEFNDLNSIQQLFNADAFENLVKELCDE